jgi:hypothetical protein
VISAESALSWDIAHLGVRQEKNNTAENKGGGRKEQDFSISMEIVVLPFR